MPKRKLKIDMIALELSFDSGFEEVTGFLDLETGQVISVEQFSPEAENYELSEQYLPVPRQDSHDGYEDMVQFNETVSDPRLHELLTVAIQGKGAFRRFKDMIARNPEVEQRWYLHKDQRLHERIAEWLDSVDIEAI